MDCSKFNTKRQTVVIASRKGVDNDNRSSNEVSQDDTCNDVSQSVKFPVQVRSHI